MLDHKTRLDTLRQVLKKQKLDAFIMPQGDMWQSEHPDACDKRFQFMCGLDSSAGCLVITKDKACVLIDDRYTIDAKNTLDPSLFDIEYYTETPPEAWAIANIRDHGVIGYDSWLHTRKQAKRMQKSCNDYGVYLQPVTHNPVDEIWGDQPTPIAQTALHHEFQYSGRIVDDKLNDIADALEENETDSVIITAPDSIAWMLNLRTIENSQAPGIKGFAIFEAHDNRVTVFTDVDCVAFNHGETKKFEVDFLPLDDFKMAIHHFEQKEQIVQIADSVPDWLTEHLNAPASEVITHADPCEILKAIKNDVEQQGIRACHKRDARAMKNIIKYIKKEKQPSEIKINNQLINERKKCNQFRGVSFDSIVGWNANGAKVHGSPTDTIVDGDGLLLIDSGGQYDDGTTDITRTIAVGHPSEEMKKNYTLVLRAHIALARCIFPEGTTGTQLDAITRAPLWENGLNYGHGTGHGVGHFLNVHEGPCGISPRSDTPILEGMLLSNEPGYYKEGAYGIRLENLMLVQECDKGRNNETGKKLLCFETVTFVPFDEYCIIREMLSDDELHWLDWYQKATN